MDSITQKRKWNEMELLQDGIESEIFGLPPKKVKCSSNNDTEAIFDNIPECCKTFKDIIPKKMVNYAFNELGSRKFLEFYEMNRGTKSNVKSNSHSKHSKVSVQKELKVFKPNSTLESQINKPKRQFQNVFSPQSKYISNPFVDKTNAEHSFQNPFIYQASTDQYINRCPSKKSLLQDGKKKSFHQFETFMPKHSINLDEKSLYSMYVEQFSDEGMFFPNCFPAIKNFKEYEEKLNNLNFEKKIEQVLTIKSTSNISDIVFYDDDEPLILDIKPSINYCGKDMKKFNMFSPKWVQEHAKDVVDRMEKMRLFMEKKKHVIKKYQEKRSKRWRKKLQELPELNLSAELIKAFNLKKKLVLPELTNEMNAIIEETLMQYSMDHVVSKIPHYTILRKDIDTLVSLNWLNDEIINTYLDMIKSRSKQSDYPSVYVFSSFFYPKLRNSGYSTVRRWTRKDDIFSYDINLVPLHLGMHWCLAVIDHRYKKIQYYDSLNSKENCTAILKDYLIKEFLDKKKQSYDISGWILENMENIPQQLNGSDCGMFTLKYAEYVTRNAEINFSQEHMPYFRRKMIYEIVTGQLV